jgi:hypothetical protein
MRKCYITPGSVRIYGLPGTGDFGARDNGSGQMWTEERRIGSINYWTGDVVLAREFVPKLHFWDELLNLFRLKKTARPNCQFEVSALDVGNQPERRFTGLNYPLVSGRYKHLVRVEKRSGPL